MYSSIVRKQGCPKKGCVNKRFGLLTEEILWVILFIPKIEPSGIVLFCNTWKCNI